MLVSIRRLAYTLCYPPHRREAGSLRDCQAKCTAREHCNTVNWHERNTMCKQYMCLRQVGMRTREILGYEIYTWITTKANEVCARANSLCFTFHVGAWGECLNMPNFTSDWRFTPPTKWSDCELVKSRPVVCKGSDGKTYPDSFCMRGGGGKPQQTSICFGSCGFNRTCDELAWHSRKRVTQCKAVKDCGYVGSYTSCGSMSVLGQYRYHRSPRYNYLGCHGETYNNGGLKGYIPIPYRTSRHGGGSDTTSYYSKRTHSDIGQQCSDMGARLCSLDELLSGQPHYFDEDKVYKRACGYGRTFWSSTPCGPGNQGFLPRQYTRTENLGKQCALPEELHNLACCSNWNLTLTNFTREVEQNRLSRNVSLGNYHYCKNSVGYTTTNPGTPCGAYEGHCRNDKDCQFGTKCAMLAASKYGMIDGGSACIPTYNEQQIEFWPKKAVSKYTYGYVVFRARKN